MTIPTRSPAVPLTRAALHRRTGVAAEPAPVRIVHLGLGAFHRAHQAWYTAHAVDAAEWGIAAFTGRTARAADRLAPQGGLYCLVTRGADADDVEVIASISEVNDGARVDRLAELLSDPGVALVTLTITEAGYEPAADDLDSPTTPLARLLCGLDARRRSCAAPIAIVSCDNLPRNAEVVRDALLALADRHARDLADWIRQHVSFVSTSVDRITPHIDNDVPAVADAGWLDAAPVVTESFADWVLAGDFPAGRPQWETAGARFVDDIEPWENRKLWLLNGAHSILATTGMIRGHETVADAIADPACRAAVDAFWADAVACLPDGLDTADYRRDVLARFSNPRIIHRLAQIAEDGLIKARYRFTPVAQHELDAGRDAAGSATAIAAWIEALTAGIRVPDANAGEIDECLTAADPVAALVRSLSPALACNAPFVALVRDRIPSPTTRIDAQKGSHAQASDFRHP